MSRIAYVNGHYVPHGAATIHIEDRGYQFADGIYEVCEIRNGVMSDVPGHLDRLERSAGELRLSLPLKRTALEFVMKEIKDRNRVWNGLLYLQVTRGVAPRNHLFPAADVPASIVMTARATPPHIQRQKSQNGVDVITVKENRWERVDIKTISLLPNVLAKQAAHEAGAYEAWFVDAGGFITEGSSTNAWIVNEENELITRPADHGILRGITRMTAMRAAQSLQLKVIERAFSIDEALAAKEAFITAATTVVVPVTRLNGQKIGDGKPGNITVRLQESFYQHVR